jgi:hypothetical protein
LLAGYIEKHKDICLEEDCPLKSSKKKRGSKNEVEMSFEVSLLKLIQVIDRLYSDGVKK